MTTIAQYLQDNLSTPFEWGVNDCVTFSLRWVYLRTGVDHLAELELPPIWTTEREALRAIQGVGGLEAAFNSRFKSIDPNYACDGDLALSNGNIMIFTGSRLAGLTATGLTHINRMEAVCAWAVV